MQNAKRKMHRSPSPRPTRDCGFFAGHIVNFEGFSSVGANRSRDRGAPVNPGVEPWKTVRLAHICLPDHKMQLRCTHNGP